MSIADFARKEDDSAKQAAVKFQSLLAARAQSAGRASSMYGESSVQHTQGFPGEELVSAPLELKNCCKKGALVKTKGLFEELFKIFVLDQ